MQPSSPAHYIRHGQSPFFRLPLLNDEELADYAGKDAVLLGVPYDGGTTYLTGARVAPYHVRRVSAFLTGVHPVHRIDTFSALKVMDGGNVPVAPFAPERMREQVHGQVSAVYAAGGVPFVVGGDHSVSIPCLRAAAEKHGELAIVHVDAHFDTSDPSTWGEAFHHGTPIRHAIEQNWVAKGQLVQVGLRGPWKGADEAQLSTAHDARLVPAREVRRRGVEHLVEEIKERVGKRPLYLSVDIDAVDPAFAPGTGTPVPGGMDSQEILELVSGLGGVNLVGFDLVELSPPTDHGDITCLLGAHILFEGLNLLARR